PSSPAAGRTSTLGATNWRRSRCSTVRATAGWVRYSRRASVCIGLLFQLSGEGCWRCRRRAQDLQAEFRHTIRLVEEQLLQLRPYLVAPDALDLRLVEIAAHEVAGSNGRIAVVQL